MAPNIAIFTEISTFLLFTICSHANLALRDPTPRVRELVTSSCRNEQRWKDTATRTNKGPSDSSRLLCAFTSSCNAVKPWQGNSTWPTWVPPSGRWSPRLSNSNGRRAPRLKRERHWYIGVEDALLPSVPAEEVVRGRHRTRVAKLSTQQRSGKRIMCEGRNASSHAITRAV